MDQRNPSATLDAIRAGRSKLLATARTRIAEVEKALDEGRFADAQDRCADLYIKLTALADAERSLGVLARGAPPARRASRDGGRAAMLREVLGYLRSDEPPNGLMHAATFAKLVEARFPSEGTG